MTLSKLFVCVSVLALLGAVAAGAPRTPRTFSESDYQNFFTDWVQQHTKAYTAPQFFQKFAAFKANLDLVEQWNARGSGHELETNHLADLTNSEYRSLLLGWRPERQETRDFMVEAFELHPTETRSEKRACANGALTCQVSSTSTLCCTGFQSCAQCIAYAGSSSSSTATHATSTSTHATTATTAATSTHATTATTATSSSSTSGSTTGTSTAAVDWRTKNVLTPVKNQGQCGSCWSFSVTGAVEAAVAIKTGKAPVSLSEQNLVDCVTASSGCNGGSPNSAFKYISTNKGIDTETSYPYKGVQGSCAYNAANIGATLTGTNGYSSITKGSESALQAQVAKQPVSVAIDASLSSFQLYKSGTYSDASCSSTNLDHAVLAVGYGTDSTGDYWIVKNSWGTGWGIKGFFQLARNAGNKCGIATSATYPVA